MKNFANQKFRWWKISPIKNFDDEKFRWWNSKLRKPRLIWCFGNSETTAVNKQNAPIKHSWLLFKLTKKLVAYTDIGHERWRRNLLVISFRWNWPIKRQHIVFVTNIINQLPLSSLWNRHEIFVCLGNRLNFPIFPIFRSPDFKHTRLVSLVY